MNIYIHSYTYKYKFSIIETNPANSPAQNFIAQFFFKSTENTIQFLKTFLKKHRSIQNPLKTPRNTREKMNFKFPFRKERKRKEHVLSSSNLI